MLKYTFIFLVLASNVYSQCKLEPIEVFKKAGETVTMHWNSPNNTEGLLYYRIRRAQLISGTFVVIKTLPPTQTSYSFTWTGYPSYYYFVTAWWGVKQPDGSTKAVEGIGSNQIRVRAIK